MLEFDDTNLDSVDRLVSRIQIKGKHKIACLISNLAYELRPLRDFRRRAIDVAEDWPETAIDRVRQLECQLSEAKESLAIANAAIRLIRKESVRVMHVADSILEGDKQNAIASLEREDSIRMRIFQEECEQRRIIP